MFVQYTIEGSIKSGGQSVMVLFAFEYVILASHVFRHGLKYLMSIVSSPNSRVEGGRMDCSDRPCVQPQVVVQ